MRTPRGSWDGVVHVKYLVLGHPGTSKQFVSYLDTKIIHLVPLSRLTYNFDRWFPSCVTFNWTNRCGYLIYVKTQLDLKNRCSLVCPHKQSSTSVPPAGPETQARHTWVDGKCLNQTYLTLGQILQRLKPPSCHNGGVASSCHGRCPSQPGRAPGTWRCCWSKVEKRNIGEMVLTCC